MTDEKELGAQLRQLYLEILDREPDELGFNHYLYLLKEKKQTISAIRQTMINSDEAKAIRLTKENQMEIERRKSYLKHPPKFQSSLSKKEITKMMNSVSWYHTFEISGVKSGDTRTSTEYQMWAAQGIPTDLSDKTVLDIGAADGFYSFLAEYRGAKRVLALDFMKWEGFDVAKKILNSNVEHKILSIENLEQLNETFDIVLFFGVYYHLPNPVDALQKIFSLVNEQVFLAGHIIDSKEPLMCYYDKYEMHPNDDSNWWAASPNCIIQIAKRIGFRNANLLDKMFQKEMLSFQTEEAKNSIRRLGNIGVFEFTK